jgi:hypothetical protein
MFDLSRRKLTIKELISTEETMGKDIFLKFPFRIVSLGKVRRYNIWNQDPNHASLNCSYKNIADPNLEFPQLQAHCIIGGIEV